MQIAEDCDGDPDNNSVTIEIWVNETPKLIFKNNLPFVSDCVAPESEMIETNCNSIAMQINSSGQEFSEYAVFYAESTMEGCQPLDSDNFVYQSVDYTEDIQYITVNGLTPNTQCDIWIVGIEENGVPNFPNCNCTQESTDAADETYSGCGLPVAAVVTDDITLTYAVDAEGNYHTYENGDFATITELPNPLFPAALFDIADNPTDQFGCDNSSVGEIYNGGVFSYFTPPGAQYGVIQPAYIDLQDCFQINQIDLFDGNGSDEFQIHYTTDEIISGDSEWIPLFDPHYVTETFDMWVYLQTEVTTSARYLRVWPQSGSFAQGGSPTEPEVGEMRICGVLNAGFTTEIECLTVDFIPDYGCGIAAAEWIIEGVVYNTAQPEHTFTAPGTYNVTHILTHDYGDGVTEDYSITQPVTVTAGGEGGLAEFSYTTDCLTTSFAADPDPADAVHLWFIDGVQQSETSSVFTIEFPAVGSYTIEHGLVTACEVFTAVSETVTITATEPSPTFTYTENCTDGTVTFSSPITDPDFTHLWDFGNGQTAENTLAEPTVNYDSAGPWTVMHTVSGCTDEVTESLVITLDDCFNPFVGCCPSGSIAINGDMTLTQAIAAGLIPTSGSQSLYIDGTFTIDQNYNFGNVSEVCLGSGAAIVVSDAVFMSANGVDFHGCDEMWQGVFLNDDSNINLLGCTIEDAGAAINITTNNSVALRNNTFRKNLIGILQPEGQGAFSLMGFDNNDFNCTNTNLLPPYPGQPGEIGTVSYAGMVIESSQPSIHSWPLTANNYMSDMANGIIIRHSSTTATYGITYENIYSVPDYEISGNGIANFGQNSLLIQRGNLDTSPSFINCETAIHGKESMLWIRYNTMLNVGTGILGEGGANLAVTIFDNDIETTGKGIELNQFDQAVHISIYENDIDLIGYTSAPVGIDICEMGLGQNNSTIHNNTINVNTQFAKGISIMGAVGHNIYDNLVNIGSNNFNTGISLDGGSKNRFSCNEVNGAQTSYQTGFSVLHSDHNIFVDNTFNQSQVGMRFSGACNQTMLQSSTFNSNATGLQMTASAMFGSMSTGEENAQVHHANRWIGEFSNVGAEHQTTNSLLIDFSKFIVHQPESTDAVQYPYHPQNNNGAGADNWFQQLPGSPLPQGLCLPGFTNDNDITDLDKFIAKDSALVDVFFRLRY